MKAVMTGRTCAIVLILAIGVAGTAYGQRGPGPQSARDSAPIDLTGYWVSVVTEDWRHRMATPRPGDYESIPLNAAGRRVADGWDLEQDDADGLQCKAFGVGGIMRQPGRLHVSWEDESTMRIDFDAGSQTRLLHFGEPPVPDEPTWQGVSRARWIRPPGQGGGGASLIGGTGAEIAGGGGRGQRGGPPLPAALGEGGSLVVTTSGFREGYLRKNGVPYSEDASITEYIHRLPRHPNGDVWLLVVTVVEDPQYLTQPFYTSTHFRLEPNGEAGWSPRSCHTAPPPTGVFTEGDDRAGRPGDR